MTYAICIIQDTQVFNHVKQLTYEFRKVQQNQGGILPFWTTRADCLERDIHVDAPQKKIEFQALRDVRLYVCPWVCIMMYSIM